MKRTIRTVAILLILVLGVSGTYTVGNIQGASTRAKTSKATSAAKKKTKIRLNKTKVSVTAHQTIKLKLKNAKAKKVKWSSSNKKVATVSGKGKVSALKKGKVTITAKYKGKKYKCSIKVKKALSVTAKAINGSTLLQSEYFADKLYDGENIIVSPTSLNMVLGMAANGAGDDEKKDLEKYLGKSLDKYNKYALNMMNRAKNDSMLTLANGIWYKEGRGMNPLFHDAVSRYYNAQVKEAPLNANTVQEINQWASDNTDGMIKNVIDRISDEAVAILTNALLFDGKWSIPFKASDTRKAKFTTLNGNKVTTDMMHSSENFYYENKYAIGFEKTYGEKGQYSFIAILPKVKGAFKLQNLDIKKFLKSKTDKYIVNVSMPKFTYDWNGSLTKILKTTSVKSIFDDKINPLGNMLQVHESVYASDVTQACRIIVDEEGTKAAAVTAMVEAAAFVTTVPEKNVNLNRPFGYIIMDNTTKDVLFMGKVVTPEE